jgi:hypothetical protein
MCYVGGGRALVIFGNHAGGVLLVPAQRACEAAFQELRPVGAEVLGIH